MKSIFKNKTLQGDDDLIASAVINLSDDDGWRRLRGLTAVDRNASARPWKWMKDIGEINYGVGRGGKIAGYAKITARKVNKDGTPGDVVTTGLAAEIASRISSPYGGQRGLIDRFYTLLKVPGSAYLIRCRDDDGDICGYDVLDADEIQRESVETIDPMTGRRVGGQRVINRITLPAGAAGSSGDLLTVPLQPEDLLGRIWRPAGRFVEMASSPLGALDTECELLHLLTINLKAKLTSRMALNGIFYVPSEINDIRDGSPKAKNGGETMTDNKVIDRLIQAATWAVQNFDQPAAAIPIFMSGPGNFGEMIRHIVLDQEIMATDMALRAELISRIYTGLDVQPQQTQGKGSSNHWNAFAEGADELKVNIKPDVETLCWALTRMALYREMADANVKPETIHKYCLWYDLSDAETNVNVTEDTRQAYDRMLVGPDSARRKMGYTEADAPSEIERIQAVGVKMNVPQLALYGIAEADKIDWEKIPQPGTAPGPIPDDVPAPAAPGPTPESDTPRKLRPA